MQKSDITNLRRKRDYYLHDGPVWIRTIWAKPESFNWFLKSNRNKLTELGALVRLGRDYFIDVEIFPSTAETILGLTPLSGETHANH